jgi:hypothetical protein
VSGVAGAFGCGAKPPPGQPAGRQFDRLPMPPVMDDEAPSPADGVMAGGDMEFETKPDFDDATSFTHAFGGPNVPTDPARIEAQRSEAPSTMRKFEHGVTVDGRDTFKMAQKLQTNDATLRFLAALNFDAGEGAEPGVEVIDTAIKKAVIFDDEDDAPPPPVQTADPVEIECRRRLGPRHAMDRTGAPAVRAAIARAGAGSGNRGESRQRPGHDGVVPGGPARRQRLRPP